jgi:hypothetical protein
VDDVKTTDVTLIEVEVNAAPRKTWEHKVAFNKLVRTERWDLPVTETRVNVNTNTNTVSSHVPPVRYEP